MIRSLQYGTVGVFHYRLNDRRPWCPLDFPSHNTSIDVGGPFELALLFVIDQTSISPSLPKQTTFMLI